MFIFATVNRNVIVNVIVILLKVFDTEINSIVTPIQIYKTFVSAFRNYVISGLHFTEMQVFLGIRRIP